MLTIGNLRTKKGGCILHLSDLLEYCEDLLLIVMPSLKEEQDAGAILYQLTQVRPGSVWLGAVMHRQGTDRRQLARPIRIAADAGVPLIARNEALYATPQQRPLHDV